ncbi:MAG: indole-3-glycerol-phosphate synthase [Methanobacterium sp.]|nr:indole-3-glycerol-phosphate synthase [Methanobacterium sp.]
MKIRPSISQILLKRRKTLEEQKKQVPLETLMDRLDSDKGNSKYNQPLKDFRESINHDEDVAVICEFKPASPSKGHISDSKIQDALEVFKKAGASAVSILTEENYFNGSMENIRIAQNIIELPILRKDFLMDEYQIYEAKLAGANAVLLMNDVYPDIKQGISLCRELELGYIVECKNMEDIEHSLAAGADVLGVNNRNFQNFNVYLNTTQNLSNIVPPEVVLVSESGVQGPEDAKKVAGYGADAILVGSAIMGTANTEDMYMAAKNIIESVKGLKVVRT